MGKTFELIADDAIKIWYPDETTCAFCGNENTDVYEVCGCKVGLGQYVFEKLPKEVAAEEKEGACEKCIKEGEIKWSSEWEIEDIIKKHCSDPEAEILKLRRNPALPKCIQWLDWAICCGELCEFTGSPKTEEELVSYITHAEYWDGYLEEGEDLSPRDLVNFGPPEFLDEVSKFKCKKCNKEYWIDQFT